MKISVSKHGTARTAETENAKNWDYLCLIFIGEMMWRQIIKKSRKTYFIITLIIISIVLTYNVYADDDNATLLMYDSNIVRLKHNEGKFINKVLEIYNGTEDYLINTRGCYIPNYTKTVTFLNVTNYKKTCGERAVFIEREGNDNITFIIKSDILKTYIKKPPKKKGKKDNIKFNCCYRFATRSDIEGQEDSQLSYTLCEPFEDNTTVTLQEEVITVTCYTEKKEMFYQDSYILLQKNKVTENNSSGEHWNVLMLGMDTMSRARVMRTMPSTFQYLKDHDWLDYRGYQKVGSNTFPNLMAALTGEHINTIYKLCKGGVDNCNDHIIWSEFRKNGYMTAYGEDYLSLPDTFNRYNGFKTKPTHHYMRPFFLAGEKHEGNIICANHRPSAKHLLDYAREFVDAYKNNKFFGLFWINSYSHNLDNNPEYVDKDIVDFIEQLEKTGIMNNTFIVFFSDHGIRFGNMRIQMESYYEERLPMFLLWTPHEFRRLYLEKYYNLQINQNRLVSPYDLYATLAEISNTIAESNKTKACPQCSSLFEEKSDRRTCVEAGVSDKWCSCHGMNTIDTKDPGANASLELAVSYVQNKSLEVKTIDCWACSPLKLNKAIRTHWYKDINNKTNYVVAFEMVPGNVSYEATVVRDDNEYTILEPTDTISAYNTRGNCVIVPSARVFCVCEQATCKENG